MSWECDRAVQEVCDPKHTHCKLEMLLGGAVLAGISYHSFPIS